MSSTKLLLFLCALVSFSTAIWAKSTNLLLSTDLDCRLSIDGKAKGVLKTGAPRRVSLALGEHHVEAIDIASGAHWEDTVKADGVDPQTVAIPLRAAVTKEELKRGYWTDPNTGLTWAAADNGSAIIYTRAEYYCRSLTLGGLKDWNLPSIDELKKLFGGPVDAHGFHTTSPIKLSGWEWSSSPGMEPGEQWALDFGDGGRSSVVIGDSGLNRALCVHRAK